MFFASYSPCIESQRLRRMETRRLGVRSKQRAIGISVQRAQSTHLALRAALLVIDHTNKFGCFNHKVHHGGTPWALLIVRFLLGTFDCHVRFRGCPPLGTLGVPWIIMLHSLGTSGHPSISCPSAFFRMLMSAGAPPPWRCAGTSTLSLCRHAGAHMLASSARGRRRNHPGVRPAKGQCRSRSVLTPLALDALGPFSPHPTAQVLRLA